MNGELNFQFDHVHVFCTDLSATERWFVEGLGAELVGRGDSLGTPSARVRLAGVDIAMRTARPSEQLQVVPSPRYGEDHIGMRVPDVDAAIEELRRRGVTIDMEPKDIGADLRIAFVSGPDNLRVEIVQHKGGQA